MKSESKDSRRTRTARSNHNLRPPRRARCGAHKINTASRLRSRAAIEHFISHISYLTQTPPPPANYVLYFPIEIHGLSMPSPNFTIHGDKTHQIWAGNPIRLCNCVKSAGFSDALGFIKFIESAGFSVANLLVGFLPSGAAVIRT